MSYRGGRGLALVSGGAGDIGAAICRALHADGWGIVIGYVSRERADLLASTLHADGAPIGVIPLDLTDSDQVRRELTRLLAVEERVDALVLNAGWNRAAPFTRTDEDQWRTTVQINLTGPMLLTQLCLPGMIAAGSGTVVGVTSEAAKTGDAGNAVYALGKAGLAAFFRSLVREHSGDGIRFNSVAPGPIDTSLLRSAFADADTADERIDKLVRLVPLRRLGRPEEVAAAVRFLVSEGTHITGEHLSVGGGVVM